MPPVPVLPRRLIKWVTSRWTASKLAVDSQVKRKLSSMPPASFTKLAMGSVVCQMCT